MTPVRSNNLPIKVHELSTKTVPALLLNPRERPAGRELSHLELVSFAANVWTELWKSKAEVLISASYICSPDLKPSGVMIHPIIKLKNEQFVGRVLPPFTVSSLYLQSVSCTTQFMCTARDLNYSWLPSNVTLGQVAVVKKKCPCNIK